MPPKAILKRNLGAEVRRLRLQRKLSQEALAYMAGVHTNVVGRLERGSYNPTFSTLYDIAVRLETSLQDLFASAARR